MVSSKLTDASKSEHSGLLTSACFFNAGTVNLVNTHAEGVIESVRIKRVE